jgi:hypothetical protein
MTVGATAIHQKLTKDWEAICHLGRTARGTLTIVNLEVRPITSDVAADGVTIAVIRKIAIGRARRYVRNQAHLEGRPLSVAPAPRLRGRPGQLTPQDYKKLLRRYGELIKRGDLHPTKTLFVALKREGVTRGWGTVRTWLSRARKL